MPTTYAHWRFGDCCIKTLPEELQELVNNNREIFDYGVHGPDIYFYYNCIRHNDINQYGTNMHDIPFKDTLKTVKANYKSVENKEAALAYMLGFACHFMLDSYCHGFIEKADEETEFSHGRMESQFDKYLLVKDGFDPIKTSVTFSLKPSTDMAQVISKLFGDFNEETIYKTLKDQRFYCNLLKDDSDFKRSFLEKLMDFFKVSKFKKLLITTNEYKGIEPIMLRLDKYFNKATEHYPKIALSLVGYLESGKKLDAYFKNHFCPKKDYKNLPLLSIDAEKNYEVEIQD